MSSFLRDDRGALSILGLFFVLLTAALMFGIWGIASTILQREGLQDAADAATYSAAVLHARGMNLLVAFNLIMAALVAVLIALRLAQALCIAGSVLCFAAAWVTFGASIAPGTLLSHSAVQFENAFNQAKRVIFPMLSVLHQTERATSMIIPWVATGSSVYEAIDHHPAADFGVALPSSLKLPVEADEFPVLCGRAGGLAADLALKPLKGIGVPSFILDAMSDALEGLASSMSGYLCGDGGNGNVPTYSQTIEEGYPSLPELQECVTSKDEDVCDHARQLTESGQPDESNDGHCKEGRCDQDHPYTRLAAAARTACEPGRVAGVKNYTYQLKHAHGTFKFQGGQWVEQFPHSSDEYELITDSRPPCGPGSTLNWREWNNDSGPFELDRDPAPLCSNRHLPDFAREGQVVDQEWDEVVRLFSCTVEVPKNFEMAEEKDQFGSQGSNGRSSHRLQKIDKDDKKVTVPLGSETFQIRGVAIGPAPGLGRAEPLVRIAGKTGDADLSALQQTLGALGVAQAEYYFDHQGNAQPEDFMWQLAWMARLKRFRLPSDEEKEAEKKRQDGDASERASARAEYGGKEEDQTLADNCNAQNQPDSGGGEEDRADTSQHAANNGAPAISARCSNLETDLGSLNDILLH